LALILVSKPQSKGKKMIRFSKEHLLFRETVRLFIEREINPYIEQWEDQRAFPRDLYKKLGNEGYLGLTYPEEYGGLDLDFWYTVILMEELGKIGAGGIPMSLTVQTDISTPVIALYGSHELKERFLRPAIMGDFIGALAITEKKAGSDVSAITTTAKKEQGSYIINGKKCYITNGSIADFVVTLCKTSESEGLQGMSLIVVPTDRPGFRAEKKYEKSKIGNFCCDHVELTFENVKVPKENLLGIEGRGWDMQMEQFQHERIIEGILICSQAQTILDQTKAYAKQRKIFGKRMIEHQNIAFALVNMETELEFLRQMSCHCVEIFISGKECTREISMLKMKAGKVIRQLADDCLQLFGGYGYLEHSPISRLWRDVRASAFTGGSVETMQHILTRFL
jgi:citronellyl-CoA dehydrogenase